MAEHKPDLVKAKWLGAPVDIPALGVHAEHGDVVDGIPRGEAEASDNWEIVTGKKKEGAE